MMFDAATFFKDDQISQQNSDQVGVCYSERSRAVILRVVLCGDRTSQIIDSEDTDNLISMRVVSTTAKWTQVGCGNNAPEVDLTIPLIAMPYGNAELLILNLAVVGNYIATWVGRALWTPMI